MDDFGEINMTDKNLLYLLNKLQSDSRLTLVGSRGVLKDLPDSTDWDFIAEESDELENILWIYGMRPVRESHSGYFDDATCNIFKYHSDYLADYSEVQVVFKTKKHYPLVQKFWRMMRARPELFKESFWKSNPKYIERGLPRGDVMNLINTRINFMITDILPYL